MPSFAEILGIVLRAACSPEACSNQPPSCPVRTTLATTRPDNEAHHQAFGIEFRNAAPIPAKLQWLSLNGTVGATLAHLSPGQARGVSARTGDVFIATAIDASGHETLLMEYFTGPAIIRECASCRDEPLVLCPPRSLPSHNASEKPAYEPAGFVNVAPDAVDVYQYDGTRECEQLLTRDGPVAHRGQRHFASKRGQRLRARRRSGTPPPPPADAPHR